jgi:hypothetical protein
MKRSDAETIAEILDDIIRGRRGTTLFPNGREGTPSNLGVLWINEIEKIEDAELATKAAVALFTETTDVPTPVDYRALLRKLQTEERMKAPALPEAAYVRDVPPWVKAWIVARYRHRDFRVLPEQKPGYDTLQTHEPHFRTYVWPDQESMPVEQAAVYAAEGAGLSVEDVFHTLKG